METIYCSKCGTKNSKDASFCGNCGEKISLVAIEKNNCPSCDYVASEDEKYCPECGTALTLCNEVEKTPKSQPKPTQKKKSRPAAKTTITPTLKKKKGGVLRTLGKVALWIFGIGVLGVVALYFIGDRPNENISQKTKDHIQAYENNKNSLDKTDINSADKYRYGIDVTPDQYEAVERYKVFAEKGDLNAMIGLSEYYELGIWVEKDRKKAKALLEKAAKEGSLEAQWELEFLNKKSK